MEQAIKLAIEGGYKLFFVVEPDELEPAIRFYTSGKEWTKVTSDPLFWQALGKALGWGAEMIMIDEEGHPKEWCYFNHCPVCGDILMGEQEECPNECNSEDAPIISWVYEWHNFIDHLIAGKDPETYFTNLLTEQGL